MLLLGAWVPPTHSSTRGGGVVGSRWRSCEEMTIKGHSFLLRNLIVVVSALMVSGGIFSAERPPLIEEFGDDYGVDVTAPIHHYLDDRSYFGKRYDKMIGG